MDRDLLTLMGRTPPPASRRHMIALALRRSLGSESDRMSWMLKSIPPASAVETYTQKDRFARSAMNMMQAQHRQASDGPAGERDAGKRAAGDLDWHERLR